MQLQDNTKFKKKKKKRNLLYLNYDKHFSHLFYTIFLKEKKDLVVKISLFNQRVQSLIFCYKEIDEKNNI
jgi:hypothetical protein